MHSSAISSPSMYEGTTFLPFDSTSSSFFRPVMVRKPSASRCPRSPVCSQPSRMVSAVACGFFQYPVITSGPRRGKQFTYTLFDERVPAAPNRDRDEALHDLTRRYLATRGPATVHDFAWWSGLTVADAKRGVESAASFLERETRDGDGHWHVPLPRTPRSKRVAHLLPNFDEYFVGFRDRSAIADRLRGVLADRRVDALMGHVVCVDGQIVGGWRRTLGKTAEVELRLFVRLTTPEHRLVRAAVERFGRFLQLPLRVLAAPTRPAKNSGPAPVSD